jgi:hypothetical protein
LDNAGYGRMMFRKVIYLAHRLSWELNRGAIPNGMQVCHHCDNPSCVRPDHLFLGSIADNIADSTKKGRRARGTKVGTSRFTEEEVRAIRFRFATDETATYKGVAREYGCSPTSISNIVQKVYGQHLD